MVTPDDILATLPPDQGKWELIKRRQYVKDIVKEICTAQVMFSRYYDQFSYMFYTGDAEQTAEMLYQFCKRWIDYEEESVYQQTSSIPTGILERGYGDCKHYALFNGGVLGSLNRLYDAQIDWCYCFAGYNGAKEPYHVFIIIDYQGEELWLDPTPGSGGNPSVEIRKKVS